MAVGDPWCESGPINSTLYGVYWFVHFCWLCNIMLTLLGSYKLFKNKQMNQPIFKINYFCIGICFIISPPGFAFGFQAGWECWYNSFRPWEATYMVGVGGYLYGLAFLYLFFMLRLKFVFDGTKLKLGKFILFILYLGLLTQFFLPIPIIFYFLAGWDDYNRTWALTYFNTFTAVNITSTCLVLAVFIRQILILSRSDYEINNINNQNNNNNQKRNDSANNVVGGMQKATVKRDLMRLIIRYLVCAVFAMLSTLAVVIVGIIRTDVPSLHDNLEMRGIHIGFHILDETINLICLCLQFPFGQWLYSKCCRNCDLCATQCLKSTVLKKMNLQISKGIELQSKTTSSKLSIKESGNTEEKSTEITSENTAEVQSVVIVTK